MQAMLFIDCCYGSVPNAKMNRIFEELTKYSNNYVLSSKRDLKFKPTVSKG